MRYYAIKIEDWEASVKRGKEIASKRTETPNSFVTELKNEREAKNTSAKQSFA